MSGTSYSGSLSSKRKAELVDIAQSLGLPDAEGKMSDLIKSIQNYLDVNESGLSKSPMFKGLYVRRRHHDSDSEAPMMEVKNTLDGVMDGPLKKSRKSINKTMERVANAVDPANIALPDSPLNVNRIVQKVNENMPVALVPSRELTTHFNTASNQLVKFTTDSRNRVDLGVRRLQHLLSDPNHIASTAVSLELVYLLCHVTQFYDHTVFFPPPGGETGTISSLLHNLFFWMPSFALTFRLPEVNALMPGSEVWAAVTWWVSTTVLPALALSTVVSFVPQNHVAKTGHNTRRTSSPPSSPTFDPLSFAIFRLAALIYPLTSVAPSAVVDALELSGDLQGRALGAGLLVALLLAHRLSYQ